MTILFRCPHCDQPGIRPLRKAILSPGLLATCQCCQATSTIRYRGWLAAMLPGTLLMIAALLVDSAALEWSLNICGLLLMIIIPFLFAPLHREQSFAEQQPDKA
jgi:hypothetical protein